MSEPAEPERVLRRTGSVRDHEIDLAEAALALGSLDRPRVSLERYRDHLSELGERICEQGGDIADAEGAADILRQEIAISLGYDGDRLSYDDMQNANLLRVIDRRRGLPVSLAVIYVHAARAAGWQVTGVNFPAHFLVRLDHGGQRTILDPFNGGRQLDAAGLRQLTKSMAGEEAELDPTHLEPVGNRDTLLRLQNNILTRDLASGRLQRAQIVLGRMLLIAPERAELHRQTALLSARLDKLSDAITAAERYAALAINDVQRHEAAALLQELRKRLN